MESFELTMGALNADEQGVVSAGFMRDTAKHSAPPFEKRPVKCLAYDAHRTLIGAVTAEILWNWIYIDELWVDESTRGTGLGRRLMDRIEKYASSNGLVGVWLWTQSWQAADFYRHLGYQEFTRFVDFPIGHSRIGLRKQFKPDLRGQ